MQIHKIQNNTGYNPKFNGEIKIYNCHKNRYFLLDTIAPEDKILSDFFYSFVNFLQGKWKGDLFSQKMKPDDLLKFIKTFPKTLKGFNLPKPSETSSATISYYRPDHINYHYYEINVDNAFWIKHWFHPDDFEYLNRK